MATSEARCREKTEECGVEIGGSAGGMLGMKLGSRWGRMMKAKVRSVDLGSNRRTHPPNSDFYYN